MEAAGSAVGIASLGIQVCQGLLSYYDSWKGYKPDIRRAYDSIDELCKTLALIKDFLDDKDLEEKRRQRVKECVNACNDRLEKLKEKLHKLQKYDKPEGLGQKAWSEIQRAWYPLRESTLVKLREIADDAQERLKLALQVLQLDVSASSQKNLAQVVAQTGDLVNRAAKIETSLGQISTQNQRLLTAQYLGRFMKITAWLSPPDPWTNHKSARNRCESRTGTWLLKSSQYQQWRSGSISHIWMYGKAGCGKTVLCSTAIEDMMKYCKDSADTALAVFYFSFSDDHKQSYEDLLRSLVIQLGWKEPAVGLLQQAYDKPGYSIPGRDELETILLSAVASYDKVFLVLDALDECPEGNDVRQIVLDGLARVSQAAANLKVFATSRENLSDVDEAMGMLEADPISIPARFVDVDIQKYVTTQLSRIPKLSRLDQSIKRTIEEKISGRADGM